MGDTLKPKSTILVVDDRQENIEVVANILGGEYSIKVAKSGAKAIEIAANYDIDLILLDIVMPQMDGYEVCKILKSEEKTKNIPIIFVTGNDSQEDEEFGFELGAVDYITKPYKPTIIKVRVKTHIALKTKRDTLKVLSESLFTQNKELSRYISLVDQNVVISSTDLDGNITQVSEAFCKISGYEKHELIGKNHRIIRHPDMPSLSYQEMWSCITNGETWSGEIKNKKKDGGHYWVKATISPVFDENNQKIGYTAIRQDITDKKIIEEISITDGLTNIYNRRYFNDTFPKILNSAKRTNELVSFLILDIDHFKQYNDNYGHQKGDEVLIEFAKSIKQHTHRADDYTFRLGGEEFGVIFKADSKEKALEFAQTLRESLKALRIPHNFSSVTDHVTASMGLVCRYAGEIKSMDAIFKEADDLLYSSKANGRDRVSIN